MQTLGPPTHATSSLLTMCFSSREAHACFIKLSQKPSQWWDHQAFLVLFSKPRSKSSIMHILGTCPLMIPHGQFLQLELFWQGVHQSTKQCPWSSCYCLFIWQTEAPQGLGLCWSQCFILVSLPISCLWGMVSIPEPWHRELGFFKVLV